MGKPMIKKQKTSQKKKFKTIFSKPSKLKYDLNDKECLKEIKNYV